MMNVGKPHLAFQSVSWLAQSSHMDNMRRTSLNISHLIGESHELLNPMKTELSISPSPSDLLQSLKKELLCPGITQALSSPETVSPLLSPLAAYVVPLQPTNDQPPAHLDFQAPTPSVKDEQFSPCSSGTLSPARSWGSELSLFSDDAKVSPYATDATTRDSDDLNSLVFDCKSPVVDAQSSSSPSSDPGRSPIQEHAESKRPSSPGMAVSGRKGSSDSGCEADHTPSANGEEPTKGTRRLRTAFTCEQITVMEKTFKKGKYLTQSSRRKLATKLQLTENQIKTWFQNRRMKQKRETLDIRHNSLYASNLFGLPGYNAPLSAPAYAHVMHNGPQAMAYAPTLPALTTMPGGFSYSFPPAPNSFNPYQPSILPVMYTQQSPMYHPAYHDEMAYPTLQSQMYPSVYPNERHFY